MKKLFTLLFATGIFLSVQAQKNRGYDKHGSQNPHDRDYRDGRYVNALKERDAKIYRINRDFDIQVLAVQRDRRMNPGRKNKAIKKLDRQRQQQIDFVYQQFARVTGSRYYDGVAANDNRRYH